MLPPRRTLPAIPYATPRCGLDRDPLQRTAQQLVGELIEAAAVPAADLHIAIGGVLPFAQAHQLAGHFVIVSRVPLIG